MPAKVSVLQLDTDFPRVAGDVGSALTYKNEVEIIRVTGASVGKIVNAKPDQVDIRLFENALHAAQGDIVVTSCGFLAYWQSHLEKQANKTFISSSLVALEDLSKRYAPGEILILTFDESALQPVHLGKYSAFAKGIVGLPNDMHLKQVIVENQTTLDIALAGRELTQLVKQKQVPQHKHLLLECTNLPPYKAELQRATGLPITDILSLIEGASEGSIHSAFL